MTKEQMQNKILIRIEEMIAKWESGKIESTRVNLDKEVKSQIKTK